MQSKVVTQRLRMLHSQSLSNQLVTATACNWLLNAMQYNEITGKNMAFISHKEVADLGLTIENLAHDSRLWPTENVLTTDAL